MKALEAIGLVAGGVLCIILALADILFILITINSGKLEYGKRK